jgi:hypothetical protein
VGDDEVVTRFSVVFAVDGDEVATASSDEVGATPAPVTLAEQPVRTTTASSTIGRGPIIEATLPPGGG